MRTSAFLPALLIAASASAQTVNTQVNGITMTNQLTSFTDTSAIAGTFLSTAITYLTDNDVTTLVGNVGNHRNNLGVIQPSTLEGNFDQPISVKATGIYFVGAAHGTGGLNVGTVAFPSDLMRDDASPAQRCL